MSGLTEIAERMRKFLPDTEELSLHSGVKKPPAAGLPRPALAKCRVSHWLSDHSTQEMRAKGLDIADVLENWDPENKLNVEDFV